tara:strand:- start:1044 stop:1673 length:630 start_codon:yes stop_codon:yes gene_type:complete
MNKNDLVDFGNGIIELNQSLNPNNDVNGELQTLKTNYENSGSATDLYKFLHKRKEKNKNNKEFETTVKNEANDIFDKIMTPYMEHIDRANIRFTNIKNSYDISNRLKSNTDEFLTEYEDMENDVKQDLSDLKRKKSVNIRMADYYNKNYEVAAYILQILEKIYYYTIIVLIIITIIKGQYKNMMIVGRLILMIILPFIVRFIIQRTYER